jgi:hypothetical protein
MEGQMKRFAVPILSLLLLMGCAARRAQAQFIGYVSPQTVQATLATNTPCTGVQQNFTTGNTPGFQNTGQTQHYAFITYVGTPAKASASIQGLDVAGNATTISDTMQGQPINSGIGSSVIVGLGYFPQIRISVVCSVGTSFNLTYMGSSATAFLPQGTQITTEVDKILFAGAPAGSSDTSIPAVTPFGSSAGQLVFSYVGGSGPAGSTLQVDCGGSTSTSAFPLAKAQSFLFNVAQVTTQQIFVVPSSSCPNFRVQYNSGGASANTFNLEYFFNQVGAAPTFQYKNITTNGSTQVKTGFGYLHNVVINGVGTGETLTLFDNTSCAGTKIGTITAVAGAAVYPFDSQFTFGLCVTTAGTTPGDYTITFQ